MADLVLEPGSLEWRSGSGRRLLAACAAQLEAERERWALWLPVGVGVGIGCYFALPVEPPGLLGLVVALVCLAAVVVAQHSRHSQASFLIIVLLPLGVMATGFALAQFETARVAAPVLARPLGITSLSGTVIDVEALTEGMRVTLEPDAIGGLARAALPHLVRIRLRHPMTLSIGDHLATSASLMPPPGPALPGGFDFQRQAWFRGLGAVGYAVGAPSRVPAAPSGLSGRLRALRAAMTARIQAALPPDRGGIAAALITGERGAVPAQVNQDYRDSGLAHLLVIAGLHMTLVTGFVFFAVRAGLALIPAVALRYPIKKWAALAALLVALLYLVVSGAAVPTQRAFVMVALGLIAILIDRLHLSMAGVAWAAGVVLAFDPEAMVGVSFQMSFAAVVGLIAFYETFGGRIMAWRSGAGPFGRSLLHLGGIAATTIIATLATAGFSIYHFNRFSLFSVLANVVAVPIAGLWVMPWAFAACLLMPLGLERWGLEPMGWGLVAIETVARWTATLPDAVIDLPAMPDWGLLAIVAGGLWLCLWRGRWRCWGLIAIGLGIASLVTVTPPDIIASADARLVAFRIGGHYVLSSTRIDKVEAESWLRAAGGGTASGFPAAGAALGPLRCDEAGCLWRRDGTVIALDRTAAALDEDCRHAALIVALIRASRACRAGALVIDRSDLRRDGATALWFSTTMRLERANDSRGRRPWVLRAGSMSGE